MAFSRQHSFTYFVLVLMLFFGLVECLSLFTYYFMNIPYTSHPFALLLSLFEAPFFLFSMALWCIFMQILDIMSWLPVWFHLTFISFTCQWSYCLFNVFYWAL